MHDEIQRVVGIRRREIPTREPFAPGAPYEIKVDTDGAAIAGSRLQRAVRVFEGGDETATLRCVEGARAAGVCDEGEVLIKDAPASVGREASVATTGDCRFLWLAQRSFLLRRKRALQQQRFSDDDFFANQGVCGHSFLRPSPHASYPRNGRTLEDDSTGSRTSGRLTIKDARSFCLEVKP